MQINNAFGRKAHRIALHMTPIDQSRRHVGMAGLGAINLAKPSGPVPTVNPNAVVKLAK